MIDKNSDEKTALDGGDAEDTEEKPAAKKPSINEKLDKINEKLDKSKVFSYKRLFEYIDSFASRASSLHGFTEKQIQDSEEKTTEAKEKLNVVVEDWGSDISKYLKGFERIEKNSVDEMRNNVAGMRKQKDSIEYEWKGLARAPLAEIDRILWDVEKEVNALATSSQVGKDESSQVGKDVRYEKLRMPDAGPIDVRLVDKYLPIFDMSVGILLMLGLLTPVAALAAGIFLASVVLTQFPGYPGTQPTYYQAIEMVGCFVLAFADAGRFAGLDFLPWSFWNRKKSVEVG
jgi:DNA-binding ferritin-like protein